MLLIHLCNVLSVILNEKLYTNLSKCTFGVEKIVFLGYILTAQGIEIDEEKVMPFKIGLHLNL